MKEKLENINIFSFIIHSMIGFKLLTLPRDIAEHANNGGWASVLLGGALAFLSGFSFYWIGTKYPNLNYSQITEKVLGKLLGKLYMIGIGLYTLLTVSQSARAFGDSIKLFLLDKTPLYIIISLLLLACIYCLRQDIRSISIVLDILLPFILISIGLLILLASTNIEVKNLLPVFYGGPKPIFNGFLQIVHPFLGVGIIGYTMPYFANKKGLKKYITTAILTVIIIYLSIVIMSILVFGSMELKHIIYPTISLSKAILLQYEIFERAESLFISIWIPISFTTILMYYFVSCLNFMALFNTTRYNLILYLQLPILFIMALIPNNVIEVFYYLNLVNNIAKILSFALLPLIVLLVFLKERRKNSL